MEAVRMVQHADGDVATDELRARLRRMWSAVADGWAVHASFVDTRGEAVTEKLLELARLRPGTRVLELACGAGGAGLAAAELVGPAGEVVITDVAPEMTAIARGRAEALGLRNVRTRDLDLERIDEPDSSYDAVLCREGLMLVPDPARALGEIGRVLRPGGRVALAVWGPREANPWLGVVFDAVSAELGAPMPPPGIPGPFSLEDADKLAVPARAGRPRRRRGPGAADALPRRVRRGMVVADGRARRAARPEARRASGARRPRPVRPRPDGDRGLRDARRARDPGALADRRGHPRRALERARLTGAADEQPEADGYGTDGTWSTEL